MEHYLRQRAHLMSSGEPGLASARRLAAHTDALLSRLASAATTAPTGHWALVALGGYGSANLLPSSDIDLLILTGSPAARVAPFVESVLYPLWDAGLAVGHQVRSPHEHAALSSRDTTVLTASLTARVVCGDADWADGVLARCCADARRRSRAVFAAFAERARPGSPYTLEPDLKEGAGGRRDYDELVWTAATLAGAPQRTPWALVDAGVLEPGDLDRVEHANAVITAARWELALLGSSNGMDLDSAALLRIDPQLVQDAIADSANVLLRTRVRLKKTWQPVLTQRTRADDPRSQPPLCGQEVFSLLRQGDSGRAALEAAAWSGGLDDLIPGYRTLLTLRRPAIGHELTVGAHSLRCASLAARPGTMADGALARSVAAIADDAPLLVAALTHDIGKSEFGAEHPERGAPAARAAAARFGLGESDCETVADLVRLHLELPRSALHDDLDSEDSVLAVAGRIGRRELLAPLHVLSVADSIATGSALWGSWHEALLGTLMSRLDAALSPGVDGAGVAVRGQEVRSAALRILETSGDAVSRDFVLDAPLRYLSARRPDVVARHARQIAELERRPLSERFLLTVTPGAVGGSYDAVIVARNHRDLFARLAGAVTLAGLDILEASAHSTRGDVILDVLTVRSATLAPIEDGTWHKVERFLNAALDDRLELETRLKERRKHYSGDAGHTRPEVIIDAADRSGATVRVVATDRTGLLYEIARAITSLGLDVDWAKAITTAEAARDTFHVSRKDGGHPLDAGVLGHLAMRIREAL